MWDVRLGRQFKNAHWIFLWESNGFLGNGIQDCLGYNTSIAAPSAAPSVKHTVCIALLRGTFK